MSVSDPIEMKVAAVASDPFTDMPVVILSNEPSGATLAISIGIGESSAIAAHLDGIEFDRPLAHDMMTDMLRHVGAEVERIELASARDGLFVGTVYVNVGEGRTVAIDARPSDALALALRTGAPILVAREAVDYVGGPGPAAAGPTDAVFTAAVECAATAPSGDLVVLGDEAFGKWKM